MINITNRLAKKLYLAEFNQHMVRLENINAKELKPILNRQYISAAKLVQQGVWGSVDYAVDSERNRLLAVFDRHYRRVATSFSRKAFKIIEGSKSIDVPELKTPQDEFWRELNKWMTTWKVRKVTGIQRVSKRLLSRIIQKGMNEGLSHREIAKNLRRTGRISTPHRARTIALTETHTASVKSVDAAVRSTRIEMEKEWLANIDKRTRPDHIDINGKRVGQDAVFIVGGIPMKYPGDPAGGAAQTILCRCVLLYHTVRRMERLKPYEPEVEILPFPDMGVEKFTVREGFTRTAEAKITKDFQLHLSGMLSRNQALKDMAATASVKAEISINPGKIWGIGKEGGNGLYFNKKCK